MATLYKHTVTGVLMEAAQHPGSGWATATAETPAEEAETPAEAPKKTPSSKRTPKTATTS